MQVRLVLVGSVGLHDQVDVIDVDAARGDIRGDEHPHPPRGQLLEVPRALGLVQVPVQREGRDAGVVELLREHLGVRTRAGEHEGLAVAVDERGQDLCLVAVVDHENTVLDGARILVLASNLVDGGLDEELVDERGNFTVERRREQQLLTAVRGEAQDTLHRLEEAQLAHVVGFIQDRDPNL